ncbi:nibrin isoform X1 [Amia ocellicauda]|uniref:nibrin isoform X1 n=1 Tax=Amia ocellicauda TaxID=2972642 RepID=UPI0034648A4C
MWTLRPLEAGGGEPYYLLPGGEYVVGRKNCAVLLQNDQSISRIHAVLSVISPSTNQSQACPAPALTLKDSSKYGSFVNDERLLSDAPKTLQSGDRVTFGVFHSKFKVHYEALLVCSSCVDGHGKVALVQALQPLGGRLVSSWTPACTHLAMPTVKVTIKTICALLSCRPIVKPEFFTELCKAVQLRRSLPQAESFYPVIDEPSIDPADMDLNARPERKTLFQGKTFIFLNAKQHKRLSGAVGLGGGQARLLQEGSVSASVLETPGSCVIDVGPENSQLLESSSAKKWVESIAQLLRRKGLRFIPEAEIGLASIHVSTETYCNPVVPGGSETTTKVRSAILGPSLSQSMAVDETVMPAATMNITAYAPDTEPSQPSTRMEAGGVTLVVETPEKERRRGVLSPGSFAVKDPPSACEVPESGLSLFSAVTGSATEAGGAVPATSPSRNHKDRTLAADRTPTPGRGKAKSSPQKPQQRQGAPPPPQPNSLTTYFHPMGKKRDRGGDDGQVSQPKQARLTTEEEPRPSSSSLAQCGRRDGTDSARGGLAYVAAQLEVCALRPAEPPQPDGSTGDTHQNGPSRKRKEMAGAPAAAVLPRVDIEDLDSIMSEPMEEEPGPPLSASKKQRVAPAVEVKREEATVPVDCSQPEVSRATSAVSSMKQEKGEDLAGTAVKPEESGYVCAVKSEETLPRSVVVTEFKSLLVRRHCRPGAAPPQLSTPNGKNFKKFRKVPVPGVEGLPRIIGGSDLIAHRSKNSELDEWLRQDAVEKSQYDREEALAEDIFRYEPKVSKRR